MKASFWAAALLVGLSPGAAQGIAPADSVAAMEALLASRLLRCRFTGAASASWDSTGKLTVSKGGAPFDGPLHFDNIDFANRTARMVGNTGASDVHVLTTVSGLHFVENTDVGNFVLTTIFPYYTNASKREFAAVMSRHMSLVVNVIPSQAYGTCVILPSD